MVATSWFLSRRPPSDTLELTQRNVYIVPTPAGWMLGATLLLLLVASINYQLNLGYLLTFLLAGSVAVGMYVCHATLARAGAAPDGARCRAIAGAAAVFRVVLHNARRSTRYGIGLAVRPQRAMVVERCAGRGQRDGRGRVQAAAARPASGAAAHGRDTLSARHLSRLDGLAAGRAGAGVSRARTQPAAAAARRAAGRAGRVDDAARERGRRIRRRARHIGAETR